MAGTEEADGDNPLEALVKIATDEVDAEQRQRAISDLTFSAKEGILAESHIANKDHSDTRIRNVAIQADRIAKVMQYEMNVDQKKAELSGKRQKADKVKERNLKQLFELAFDEVEPGYNHAGMHRKLVLRYLQQHWSFGDKLGELFASEIGMYAHISMIRSEKKVVSQGATITDEDIDKFPLKSKDYQGLREYLHALSGIRKDIAEKAVRLACRFKKELEELEEIAKKEGKQSPIDNANMVNTAMDKALRVVFVSGDRDKYGKPVVAFLKEQAEGAIGELFEREFQRTRARKHAERVGSPARSPAPGTPIASPSGGSQASR